MASTNSLYGNPRPVVRAVPVEPELQFSGVLDRAISLFSERHNIDLSESASRFSVGFRMAAQGGDPEVLNYLMQVTPVLVHDFRYVKRSGTGGRIKGRLKLNKDFFVGEFEKRTGQHLDHPEMREMRKAMNSLCRINSGKLLKIVHKYYVVHQLEIKADKAEPWISYHSERSSPERRSLDQEPSDSATRPLQASMPPADGSHTQTVQLIRPSEEIPIAPALSLDATADIVLPVRASFSKFSSYDGSLKKELGKSVSPAHSRRKALSYDGVPDSEGSASSPFQAVIKQLVSDTKTPSVGPRGTSHDIKAQAGYLKSTMVPGREMPTRVRRITNFINKSIDSVFSNFLVWHAAIIAACSGDAKSVKSMLLLEGRLESFLTKAIIPKVAKAGFTEISKTLYKLRAFIHSSMSDILIKLVAESGHDPMVFELLRGTGSITPTGSISTTPTSEGESAVDSRICSSTDATGFPGSTPGVLPQVDVESEIQTAMQQKHTTTSVTAVAPRDGLKTLTGTEQFTINHPSPVGHEAGANQTAVTKCTLRRNSIFHQDWRKQAQKASPAGYQPPSRWRKFHMWEFGLWEFQLGVPVLLMEIESDSTWKTEFGVRSSQDPFPIHSQKVCEVKKRASYPQRTISDYKAFGLYSSGSELSISASPIMQEMSSIARTQSASLPTLLVRDIYPSFRSPDDRKQPVALTKQLHSAVKKKLGFLSVILPSKGFHRYGELKPLARQVASLHVQLKTSVNEIQGTGGGGKKFLEMAVAIDNVRCRVQNAAWEMKKRYYKMGHFPTLIEIAITPVSCSMEDVSISLTRSSNNPQFEVTLNDTLTGGGTLNLGMSPAADLSIAASKSTTSAVTSTPWRFEQFEAGPLGGGFSWTLHSLEGRPFDRLHPQCEIYSRYKPKKPFFHSPFTKLAPPVNPIIDSPFNARDGGVIFAGMDYPNAILWRFREEMRGASVVWEIKGRVHTTFVSGRGFWETRVEQFREVFQQDLQANPYG